MIKLVASMEKSTRRKATRHGVVVCDRLPGRFPGSVEYKPSHRLSAKKRASDTGCQQLERQDFWTCV